MNAPQRTPRLPRAERRVQLLAAAHSVFAEKGFHQAAMDDIAEAAQVSKPVLYQHFPGKHELYLALMDSELSKLTERLVAAVSQTPDNQERVDATVRTLFDYVSEDSGAHRILFQSDLGNDEEVSQKLRDFNHSIAESVGEVIRSQTGLDSHRALLLGRALVGSTLAAAQEWTQERDIPLQEAVDLVARLAWRGIKGFPKDPGAAVS